MTVKLPFKHSPIIVRGYRSEGEFMDANFVKYRRECSNIEFRSKLKPEAQITFHIIDPTKCNSADAAYFGANVLNLIRYADRDLRINERDVVENFLQPWFLCNLTDLERELVGRGRKVEVKDDWSRLLKECRHGDARFVRMALVCPDCGVVGGM